MPMSIKKNKRYSVYWGIKVRWKFEKHERNGRDAEGAAESNLLLLPTYSNYIDTHSLSHEPFEL